MWRAMGDAPVRGKPPPVNLPPAEVLLRVKGVPVAKPRQSRRDSFLPRDVVLRYRAWKDAIRLVGACQFREPWESAVGITCSFILPIPASWPQKRRAAAIRDEVLPLGRPDLDNLFKSVLDALSGMAYRDDSQVCSIAGAKLYGPDPGAIIHVGFNESDPVDLSGKIIQLFGDEIHAPTNSRP